MKKYSGKNISPHGLAIYVFFVILLLFFISPFEIIYLTSSVILLVLSTIIFIVSSYVFTALFSSRGTVFFQKRMLGFSGKVEETFNVCLLLASVGVLIRFADFFFFRGFDFSDGLVELRLSLQSLSYSESTDLSRAGLISAIGSVLYGFTLPLAMILITFYSSISPQRRRISIFLAIAPIIESVLNAGVMGLAFTFIYLFFALLYRWELTDKKINFRRLIQFFSIFIFAFFVGAWLFIARVESIFGDIHTYFIYSRGMLMPNSFLYSLMEIPVLNIIAFSYYWFFSYLLQGASEFSFLFDNFDNNNFLYGAKQFFVFEKFLSVLGLSNFSAYELVVANPRPGRYQTVFADIYMDFGLFGLLIQPILAAFFFSYAYISRKKGRLAGIILYPFFQASIVASPLINTLSGGRIYGLVACILIIVFYYTSINKKGVM